MVAIINVELNRSGLMVKEIQSGRRGSNESTCEGKDSQRLSRTKKNLCKQLVYRG